jgi:hypothetical protein
MAELEVIILPVMDQLLEHGVLGAHLIFVSG